jgi:hypothetical protein
MNEKIREPYYSLMYEASQGWNDHLFPVPPELLEKFAELIVLECIKLNGKELAMPGHSRMVDVYCEHFGIEE